MFCVHSQFPVLVSVLDTQLKEKPERENCSSRIKMISVDMYRCIYILYVCVHGCVLCWEIGWATILLLNGGAILAIHFHFYAFSEISFLSLSLLSSSFFQIVAFHNLIACYARQKLSAETHIYIQTHTHLQYFIGEIIHW